jgi:hypothetical protein
MSCSKITFMKTVLSHDESEPILFTKQRRESYLSYNGMLARNAGLKRQASRSRIDSYWIREMQEVEVFLVLVAAKGTRRRNKQNNPININNTNVALATYSSCSGTTGSSPGRT